MPTKRKNAPDINCEDYYFPMMLGVAHPSKQYLDELHPVWKACGREIMRQWMEEKQNAGSRPFAWWHFDAPGKRNFDDHPNQWDALHEWNLLEPWEYEAIDKQWQTWFGETYYENKRVSSQKK
jgi:hypothetical protein